MGGYSSPALDPNSPGYDPIFAERVLRARENPEEPLWRVLVRLGAPPLGVPPPEPPPPVTGLGNQGVVAPGAAAPAMAGAPTLDAATAPRFNMLAGKQPDYAPQLSHALSPENIQRAITEDAANKVTPVAAASPTKPSAIKAIRMPDGKIVFTNRDSYAGEDIGTAEAGRQLRAAQLKSMGGNFTPEIGRLSPLTTGEDLVRASLRVALREAAGQPVGQPIPGSPTYAAANIGVGAPGGPDPGQNVLGVSGRTNVASLLEDTINQWQLAEGKQRTEAANMPYERRQIVENPDIARVLAIQPLVGRQLQGYQIAQNTELAQLRSDPNFTDPKLRSEKEQEINDKYDRMRADLYASFGLKAPGIF